ncbi:MICOS complex subunit MIC25 isoform X3 [Podarcis raffonei]|uniref:MICOS complex subunit MIC25 isoform X3 n=1 Tax=Podarcis raffonei TaxID=65483 RepID=UPI00232984B8|nr:MICOS complex subunit MIC25 isoform X3 [Podarcis raffonei]
MGGGGSSHGNRKVSFEMDEQERVRVLQGIRLSEDVVKRMKEPFQPKRDHRSPSFSPPPLSQSTEGKCKTSTEIRPPTADNLGRKPSEAEEDLYKRYEQEQAMVQEELLRLAKREREAANESLNVSLQRERNTTNEEKLKAAQLNSEIYKMTLDQYNEAVTNAEDQIRRRNTQPICANLQAAILTCYGENKHQVLNCSELVKEYQRCVRLAQKELLVHFD